MIETKRLILRRWKDNDRPLFHAMGRDPAVMEFLGPLQSREDSDAAIDRQNATIDRQGHGFWAVENKSDGTFIGFCGIKPGPVDTPIEDKPEIGWRLAQPYWGQGFAKEAAQASLAWGFANLPDPTIWSITVPDNVRSWGLMESLGMTRRADLDFDHPLPGLEDRLKRHITYGIDKPGVPR
jgi:RimJ/RimL family protein N-acetyltransferase